MKTVDTRGQILWLKSPKSISAGWSPLQTPPGELTALSKMDPIAGFKWPTSKGGKGREGEGRRRVRKER